MIISKLSGQCSQCCPKTVCCSYVGPSDISSTKDHVIFSRLVIDSLRALIVWLISLAMGWQCFQGVQLLGFITITLAALMYNDFLSGRPTPILNSRSSTQWKCSLKDISGPAIRRAPGKLKHFWAQRAAREKGRNIELSVVQAAEDDNIPVWN